jgi:hypothetical protein
VGFRGAAGGGNPKDLWILAYIFGNIKEELLKRSTAVLGYEVKTHLQS